MPAFHTGFTGDRVGTFDGRDLVNFTYFDTAAASGLDDHPNLITGIENGDIWEVTIYASIDDDVADHFRLILYPSGGDSPSTHLWRTIFSGGEAVGGTILMSGAEIGSSALNGRTSRVAGSSTPVINIYFSARLLQRADTSFVPMQAGAGGSESFDP